MNLQLSAARNAEPRTFSLQRSRFRLRLSSQFPRWRFDAGQPVPALKVGHEFDPESTDKDCSCGWICKDLVVRSNLEACRHAWVIHVAEEEGREVHPFNRFHRPPAPVRRRLKRAVQLDNGGDGKITLLIRITSSQRMALATLISSYMLVPDSIDVFIDCSTSPATETKAEDLLALLMDPERVMVVTA
jgi:hypothetical protein